VVNGTQLPSLDFIYSTILMKLIKDNLKGHYLLKDSIMNTPERNRL
jgi:hypothetical protein